MALSGVADLAGRVLAGRYRLLAPIGAGASGRVYLADDVRLRRRVAVKVLHAALADDEGFLRRFRAEAQLAASLHHPNVMTVYDWGEDGVPFMVLELLDGGSLRSLLDRGRTLTPSQAAHVGRQVAEALDYAHRHGLVHRDIKPANLLFDEHGIVRVADFGLARALAEASWTEPAGAVIGTARYAAPEQATGAALDGRSDLYALALVLVEAVTGAVPFAADTPLGTLAARTTRPIDAPKSLGPLAIVVERAGMPDPGDRYPDAATMGAALADAEDALPPAGPLALAGIGEVADDPHPTQIRRGSERPLFDQDASEIEVVADEPVVVRSRADPPTGRWAGRVVATLVVLALLAATFVLASNAGAATTAVPNFVGSDRAGVAKAARNLGLDTAFTTRAGNDPAGTVIAESPTPGSWVGSGATVHLVISRGPPPVAFKDLTGQPEQASLDYLTSLGFVSQVTQQYDQNVPEGAVIGTQPKGAAAPDSVVKVTVSKGHPPVVVPSLPAGSTYAAGVAALQGVGLSPSRQDNFSDTVPAGEVISFDPPTGQSVAYGSAVTVSVSKGPDVVVVPKVFGAGTTLDKSTQQLDALGLQVQVQGTYRPGGPVRAQDPQPDATVKRGSTITLFL